MSVLPLFSVLESRLPIENSENGGPFPGVPGRSLYRSGEGERTERTVRERLAVLGFSDVKVPPGTVERTFRPLSMRSPP